jgi:pimeloyl-ACP methyl ester carboxylesterase
MSLALARIEHNGPPGATPLVIAHGLFGSGKNWGGVARRLSAGRRVVAVDMRNHGASPWADDHSYPALADDLASVVDGLGGRADVLGHSMGGKAAMVLALRHPERVRRLVIGDIAPVGYAHSQLPLVEAMRALDLAGITRRSEADRRLALVVSDRGTRAFLLQSLALEEGGATWRLNLDVLAAQMPAIMGFPPTGAPFGGPALVLRGAASDYVRPEHEAAFHALFRNVRIVTLEGAGHWLHADQPEAFADAVAAFLDT